MLSVFKFLVGAVGVTAGIKVRVDTGDERVKQMVTDFHAAIDRTREAVNRVKGFIRG